MLHAMFPILFVATLGSAIVAVGGYSGWGVPRKRNNTLLLFGTLMFLVLVPTLVMTGILLDREARGAEQEDSGRTGSASCWDVLDDYADEAGGGAGYGIEAVMAAEGVPEADYLIGRIESLGCERGELGEALASWSKWRSAQESGLVDALRATLDQ